MKTYTVPSSLTRPHARRARARHHHCQRAQSAPTAGATSRRSATCSAPTTATSSTRWRPCTRGTRPGRPQPTTCGADRDRPPGRARHPPHHRCRRAVPALRPVGGCRQPAGAALQLRVGVPAVRARACPRHQHPEGGTQPWLTNPWTPALVTDPSSGSARRTYRPAARAAGRLSGVARCAPRTAAAPARSSWPLRGARRKLGRSLRSAGTQAPTVTAARPPAPSTSWPSWAA